MDLQIIQNKIFEVRGCRVMLDLHLAELYQVETRALKQAVKRNIDRFPSDFMFELSKDEWSGLITNCDKFPDNIRHTPTPPMAFTEQGVAMLSSVLRSKVAIEVNISIMRAFVLMRQMVIGYEELLKRIEELEVSTDAQFNELYQALTQLLSQSQQQRERRPIGFATYDRSDFLYPFPKPHSPKRQRCMASQTVFREKSLWKPAQEYRKVNSRHTCFFRPHRQFPNGLNGEQELFPCFPTCKSSSLSSPPAGRSFLSFQ